jgi:hypothetical protein
MDIDIYPSYSDRRRHRPRHRRPFTILPSGVDIQSVLLGAGAFLTGAATAGVAIILSGAGW